MNKIDEFFKNKYDSKNISNEGWNNPSNELWDNIQSELPKKKSKKRFFFLLFGLISITSYLFYNNSIRTEPLLNGKESNSYEIQNTIIAKNKLNKLSDPESDYSIGIQSPNQYNESEINIENDISLTELNINKNYIQQSKSDNSGSIKHVDNVKNESLSYQSFINHDGGGIETESIGNNSSLVYNEKKADVKYHNKNHLDYNSNEIEIKDEVKERNEVLTIESLEQKNVNLSAFVLPSRLKPNIAPPIIIHQRQSDFEIGIAHSLTAFSAFNFVDPSEVEFDDGTKLENARYRNINFKYKKWMGTRLSFSTGFIYSDLNLRLCFDNDFNYESGMLNLLINEEYDDVVSRGRTNVNFDDLTIELKDNVNLIPGEMLNVNGKVDLNLKAYQIPLYFNYHFYARKTDYFIGLGASLDLLYVSEDIEAFKLNRNGIQISEDELYVDRDDIFFAQSYFFRTGFRRNISSRFKFGLDLKIDVLEPIFTSLDIGFYYTFHKTM